HFTEDEFKALQIQVREMNLLRESNVQLREENKHNFEKCQKLRQFTHTSKVEIENLQNLLGERQNEVAACFLKTVSHSDLGNKPLPISFLGSGLVFLLRSGLPYLSSSGLAE
nr:nuclear-pore anchor [Tanacetum cinerariifolium]